MTLAGVLCLILGAAALTSLFWAPPSKDDLLGNIFKIYRVFAGTLFIFSGLKAFSLLHRGRLAAFLNRINLFVALLVGFAAAVAAGMVAYIVLAGLLPVGTKEVDPADLTKISLSVVAGFGGVVALVVAYRRQANTERSRFIEGFGAAAKQLGDADAAVRIAGVYAMAAVADDVSGARRQQCIDVLCGYLRLPYSHAAGSNHQRELTIKHPAKRGGRIEEFRYQFRLDDSEVRQTIIRVIKSHLQYQVINGWWESKFDFTGACLENADFSFCIFRDTVDFSEVRFVGTRAKFFETEFRWSVYFEGSVFECEATWHSAMFLGLHTNFANACFTGPTTSFVHCIFGLRPSNQSC